MRQTLFFINIAWNKGRWLVRSQIIVVIVKPKFMECIGSFQITQHEMKFLTLSPPSPYIIRKGTVNFKIHKIRQKKKRKKKLFGDLCK